MEILLDSSDRHFLEQNVSLSKKGYVQVNGRLLHRLIMTCPPGMVIDHIDGNKLNNKRNNLRVCTRQQNTFNSKRNAKNNSGYKGVYLHKQPGGRSLWRARIKINYKTIHLGLFEDPRDAGLAYDVAAIKYFGVFARPNFIKIYANT
jgi:hypothetical protein